MVFFPMTEYWWFYIGFTAFVLALLALDLGFFHKEAHEVSFKEASFWTSFWIGSAFSFSYLFYLYLQHKFSDFEKYSHVPNFDPDGQARATASEFLVGFVIEKVLAVDNLFVFAMVFSYFKVPKVYQHRILFWGILGTLVFRALFVAIGSMLMQYESVLIFFGLILMFTSIKMLLTSAKVQDLNGNFIVLQLKKFFRVHPQIEGNHFFIRVNGLLYVTPLFIALVFLELSDVLFAVDSVPAIFSVTQEPLIVFTSNIFALLGLRSMYFMLAQVIDKFLYVKYGLAGVLFFVGLKMVWLNEKFGGKFPMHWSLMVIAFFIGASMLVSVIRAKIDQKKLKLQAIKWGGN